MGLGVQITQIEFTRNLVILYYTYSMFKSYGSAYQYLCRFTDYERMVKVHYDQTTYNLKRMRRLLGYLRNPQQDLSFIHIAGTKGKGSTALILSAILKEAGYRVGLFTSPHLVSLLERIQINGVPISKQGFTRLMNRLYPYLWKLRPTFFEIITACALIYFKEQRVDWAIMEVGLGGRLDATNVIIPKVSIITRIDFDHMDKLGNTLLKIAREKAGIIKKGVPVITLRQSPAVNRIIQKTARHKYASVYLSNSSQRLLSTLKPSFLGAHQLENAGLALRALQVLRLNKMVQISNSAIKQGLGKVSLPARIEVISRKPLIILDSAHNPVSARALRDTITKSFLIRNPKSEIRPEWRIPRRVCIGIPLRRENPKIILVISIARDKEVRKILDILLPLASIVIFTRAHNPRMCEPMEFINYIKEQPPPIPIFLERDSKKAFSLAKRLARKRDIIIITGSFYLAGEIKSLLAVRY